MRRPLSLVAGGVGIVVLDFRTEALDLVPDPAGWALIAVGAWVLSVRPAAVLASLAAGLSAAEAYLPYERLLIDPDTGEAVEVCTNLTLPCGEVLRYDPMSGWPLATLAGMFVAGAAALGILLLALRRRAIDSGDRTAAGRLAQIGAAVVAVWALPPIVGITSAALSDPVRYDPIWNGGAEAVAMLGLVVLIWSIVELSLRRDARWAIPHGAQLESPWGERR
jgi:hypothetical protein